MNSDPDGARAEFAVTVRSDIKRRGMGRMLMEQIIAYCRDQGVGEIWGSILAENQPMLGLARKLGFKTSPAPDEPGVVHASLDLSAREADRAGAAD